MDLLLGLDVGTTATKALVFDLQGNELALASYNYGLVTPRDEWVEQDAEDLWRGVVMTCRAVAKQISERPGGERDRIVALGLSSQAGTTIPLGADGQPTHLAFSWMDHRGREQAQQTRAKWGDTWVHRTSGWRLSGGLPLQHIAWFRENCREAFAATERITFVNDFVVQRLTGRLCMNPSDAGITQLMNVATGDWDDRLLDLAGIRRDQLSPMRPSGTAVGRLAPRASEQTGLPRDLVVVNGAHDQYCAAVGAGVIRPGEVLLSCGTAWIILAVSDDLQAALDTGMGISYHAVPDRWGALSSLGGVGPSLEWLLDQVWGGKESDQGRSALYESLNEAAAASPPGAGGLFFFPMGGGHDHAAAKGRGCLVGLSLAHSRGDLARAAMEGIALELCWALAKMGEAGVPVSALTMVGGAAESPLWPQIVADVSGVTVTLPASRQAASRGAAILAAVGAGYFAGAEAGYAAFRGQEVCLEPEAGNQQIYGAVFEAYQDLYRRLIGRSGNSRA